MTDLAALGLTVQSDGLLKATGTLDKFTASSDKASAGADKLSGQSGKLDGALRKLDATAGGVTSEMQKLVNATTGVSSATGDSIADHIRHGQVLDDLRAKFNPLFAASRQYELQLREIADAERLGAISAMEAAGARQRAAQSMAPGPIDQYSRAMGGAAMASANVFAQLNDIGMMMAAGQNPLQLAMQQGTQLNQVWGQMGGRVSTVGSLLRSAFMSLLNPLNLLTIGVIAGGAALVQWGIDALGAGNAGASLEERLASLEESVTRLNEITKIYSADGIQELIEKYGVIDASLLRLIERQNQFAQNQAMQDARAAVTALTDEYGGLLRMIDAGGRGGQAAQIQLQNTLGLTARQGIALRDAMEEARAASNFTDQAAALGRMNDILGQSKVATSNLAGAGNTAEAAIRQLANAAPQASWMNAAITGVNGLIGRLSTALGIKNALVESNASAGYAAELARTGQSSGPDSVRSRVQFEGGSFAAPVLGSGLASVDLGVGTSGGGGGGGASSVDEYTEAQKRALAVIADMNEAAVTQADVIGALEVMHQSGAIGADQLATAIANVKEQMADVDKVSFSLSESLSGVFADALTGAKDLQDGIKDLLGSMADLFLNAAFQKFLPTLLPGIDFGGFRAAGGPVSGGRSYVVGENGPELFTPGRSGGITPNHALGGSGTMVQINNYSGAPVREQRSRGPDGREIIKVIVGEELGGGGYDKQLGRYGATPAKVRR